MALFGAHRAHGDDAERAIRSAIEIREFVEQLGRRLRITVSTHSGVTFGEVVFRRRNLESHTVGDAANLAARLQGEARRAEILVDHRIYQQTRTTFAWEDRGEVAVRNRKQPARVRLVAGVRKRFAKVALGERIELAPLVGRDADLDRLHRTARESARGNARVVFVGGEVGIGKSRLIYEFHHRLPADAFHWFTGRCLSFGVTVPYFPFIELVRGILRLQGEEKPDRQGFDDALVARLRGTPAARPPRRTAIADALGHLLSIEGLGQPLLDLESEDRRDRIVDALADLLAALCSQKPTIVVLEDFHWAAADSMDLFRDLRRRLLAQPILFLVAMRPPLPADWIAEDGVDAIELQELSGRDSQRLLRHLLRIDRLPAALMRMILGKTEGNPFYLEEIILELEEQGAIRRSPEGFQLLKPLRRIEIPDTVESVVLARLDRLEQGVKRVLQCASVIGQDFRYTVLEQVTHLSRQLRDHLVRLMNDDYILQQTMIPELIYVFRHVVLRDVTYDTMLERQRAQLHARIAEAIEAMFPDRLEEFAEFLAFHYERGNVPDKALRFLEQAAAKCEKLHANHAAADCLERWKALLQRDRDIDPRTRRAVRLRIHLRLGILYRLIGRIDSAVEAYRAAKKAADQAGDAPSAVRALLGLAESLRLTGDAAKGLRAAREALQGAQRLDNPPLLASSHNLLGHFERMNGRYEPARASFEQVLALAARHGDRIAQYQALNHLGILHMLHGRAAEANEHYRRAEALARELGYRDEQAQIDLNMGINHTRLGECDRAERALQRAFRQAEESESERGVQLVLLALVDLDLKRGDFKQALQRSDQLLTQCSQSAYADIHLVALTNQARAWIAEGKLGRVRANVNTVLREAGRQANAVALFDGLSVQAEWLLAARRPAKALTTARRMIDLARRDRQPDWLPPALELASRASLALDRPADATRFARQALAAARRAALPRDEAWSLWSLARALVASGKAKPAARHREDARALAARIGDNALLALIEKSA
jgi:predicted ATPase